MTKHYGSPGWHYSSAFQDGNQDGKAEMRVREQVPKERLLPVLEICLLLLSHASPLPASSACKKTLEIMCCEFVETQSIALMCNDH